MTHNSDTQQWHTTVTHNSDTQQWHTTVTHNSDTQQWHTTVTHNSDTQQWRIRQNSSNREGAWPHGHCNMSPSRTVNDYTVYSLKMCAKTVYIFVLLTTCWPQIAPPVTRVHGHVSTELKVSTATISSKSQARNGQTDWIQRYIPTMQAPASPVCQQTAQQQWC